MGLQAPERLPPPAYTVEWNRSAEAIRVDRNGPRVAISITTGSERLALIADLAPGWLWATDAKGCRQIRRN
ncbi:hypothetical protein ABTL69_19255, partial [Acinetobacter baumannii]